MENRIEERIKPNFIEIFKKIFGSKNNEPKDVSEMSEAEIEELLQKENPELLRTYTRVAIQEENKQEEDSRKIVEEEKISKVNNNGKELKKDFKEQNKQRQSGGYEPGD